MADRSTEEKKPEGRPNRLVAESSPYLQQHAYNPVDWYPWGREALEAARRLDRPIFLSIGYSACHWCHVMEHESFEDRAIAALMNAHFVNIKVDREERPDLDQIYMTAVTALTGRGGWPMSVFLTPDLKPFYGGTYWPPTSRMGMPGFREILEQIHHAWVERRDEVERGSTELTDAIVEASSKISDGQALDSSLLKNAEAVRLRAADRSYGGFGGAPKFPHPMDLRLLLRTARRFGNSDAKSVALLTLDKMSAGGIYDHLGGGFHRYSTDARWLVPHFEKMLYDNALLTPAYVEAYQVTQDERYARVVQETLQYVLREMTDPRGGFYSTQDADSEGEEGRFFVWSSQEISGVLGEQKGQIFNYCYDVTPAGNWEGKNILNRVKPHKQAAQMLAMDPEDLDRILADCRQRLFAHREARVHPGRDEKVITGWNGFMISAFAQAGSVFDRQDYKSAAVRAADFLLDRLRDDHGRLLHVFKDDRASHNAFLDDYAATIDSLVEVYQATFEPRFVEAAVRLADEMIARFADSVGGGFFYTASDHEPLIARTRDVHDSATPSGNGLAAYALARLARLTGNTELEERARRTLEWLSGEMARVSMASAQALLALDNLLGPAYELVLVDGDSEEESAAALRSIRQRFLPSSVIARREKNAADSTLSPSLSALLSGKSADQGRSTLYICEGHSCRSPIVGLESIQAALAEL